MTNTAEGHIATLTELKHYLGTPSNPISTKEIVEYIQSLSPEERKALRRNPEVPHLDYWDLLDADERMYASG